ncbi:hypothetical protein RIN58_12585 [Siccibacter colletis]|uniref:hypothetical protein n=1 Tax=Siccibacter colletis TaxID=1505757 RepID=UPI0028BEE2E5|nr:hypothetical protein [Siccibacter colletis]WNN47250.1 hypothetical protein RIN58_12585 [Siccibacter colletis]
MKEEFFDFYEDDEGISTNVDFNSFKVKGIQVIYLESEFTDKKMIADINFIIKHQDVFFERTEEYFASYIKSHYNSEDTSFKLMKIYIFPDVHDEYGFIFRWEGDTEHGIGIRFSGLSVKEIGSSEVAFM